MALRDATRPVHRTLQAKVIKEAALRSRVSQGVMQACWDAAGEVIKAWATEGHSVALPGLGTMRFGLRAKSVEDVNKVKTGLIKTRRIIFTPSQDLKDELADTAIQITCYDRNGDIVKREHRLTLVRLRTQKARTELRRTDPRIQAARTPEASQVQVARTPAQSRAATVVQAHSSRTLWLSRPSMEQVHSRKALR